MNKTKYLSFEEYKNRCGQDLTLAGFLKRDFVQTVRLNRGEFEFLDSLSKTHECSKADYARRAICQNHPPSIPEINKSAWTELSKAAGALTQLAKFCNFGKLPEIEVLQKELAEFRAALISSKVEE